MRAFLLTAIAMTAVSCTFFGSNGKFDVTLDDGTPATVFLEKEIVEGEPLLVVDFLSERPASRENDVERDVSAIWKSVEPKAEELGLSEALIKYRFPDPEGNGQGYRGLLFEAEKIENGTWKLRKVN